MRIFSTAMVMYFFSFIPEVSYFTVVDGSNMEATLNRRYIQQKLEHGLTRIWGDVQQKVKVYLLSNADLAYFKYDEFIKVLDIINK